MYITAWTMVKNLAKQSNLEEKDWKVSDMMYKAEVFG